MVAHGTLRMCPRVEIVTAPVRRAGVARLCPEPDPKPEPDDSGRRRRHRRHRERRRAARRSGRPGDHRHRPRRDRTSPDRVGRGPARDHPRGYRDPQRRHRQLYRGAAARGGIGTDADGHRRRARQRSVLPRRRLRFRHAARRIDRPDRGAARPQLGALGQPGDRRRRQHRDAAPDRGTAGARTGRIWRVRQPVRDRRDFGGERRPVGSADRRLPDQRRHLDRGQRHRA